MVIVANVAMNGATRPKVTAKPLMVPKRIPTIAAAKIAATGLRPPTMKSAINALDKARMEPTDKSIPPVKMTKVIPKAIKALMET